VPAQCSYDYAIIRIVPFVEREEFINAGVILFCRTRRFLGVKTVLNAARLHALYPRLDIAAVGAHLALFEKITRVDAPPPFKGYSLAEKFHWLVSPRSTMVQVSDVHCGICTHPVAALESLMDSQVRMLPASPKN